MLKYFVCCVVLCSLSCATVQQPPSSQSTEVFFVGSSTIWGHYAKPNETTTVSLSVALKLDKHESRLALIQTSGSKKIVEHLMVRGDQVFRQKGDRSVQLSGKDASRVKRLIMQLSVAVRTKQDVRTPISHETFGDVEPRVLWQGQRSISLAQYEESMRWEATLRVSVPNQPYTWPKLGAVVSSTQKATKSTTLTQLDKGVWSLNVHASQSRLLVVVFKDYLAVLETSLTVREAERGISMLKQKWPNRPVRYVSFSHHHPHYTGGLRAFVAEGATVLLAPKNESYVQQLMKQSFTRRPDRLAQSPKALKVKHIKGRFVLKDETNQVELVNLGQRSQHTDDYIVFYLSRQKMLFEGDLGWFVFDGKTFFSRRRTGLLSLIKENNWSVERVVQSWPIQAPVALDFLKKGAS